ncbi:DUF4089 domain-containing protein [Nodosilinea sp. P-1105]|nr:DUF4089 domain-containing protein [Nodosilinea sp. P-1105]
MPAPPAAHGESPGLPPSDTAAYVAAMATMLDLPVPASLQAGVVANLEHIRAIAQPVITFALPDTIESAATFEP